MSNDGGVCPLNLQVQYLQGFKYISQICQAQLKAIIFESLEQLAFPLMLQKYGACFLQLTNPTKHISLLQPTNLSVEQKNFVIGSQIFTEEGK
jgi:hypothetical protein